MSEPVGLGDIIRLSADRSSLSGDYIIKYLDTNTLVIVDALGNETTLVIDKDTGLKNEGVNNIFLLHKADQLGFAKQNNLLPGEQIKIRLNSGDELKGEVAALDEDKISVKLTTGEMLHIDFEYKGLDPKMGIKQFVIVEAHQTNTDNLNTEYFATTEQSPEVVADSSVGLKEEELISETDIKFGQELPPVAVLVEVPDEEKRYGVERQELDLLNELLASVPTGRRNRSILAKIHQSVETFGQLRKEFSIIDELGAVVGFKSADLSPLRRNLQNLDQNNGWLFPMVSNIKKIYIGPDTPDALYYADIEAQSQKDLIVAADEVINPEAAQRNGVDLERRIRTLSELWLPSFPTLENNFQRQSNGIINSFVNNGADMTSTVFGNGAIQEQRFVQSTSLPGTKLTRTTKLPGGDKRTDKYLAAPAQKIDLIAFLCMPLPVVELARRFLLGSNIMLKSEYAQILTVPSDLLNKNTRVQEKTNKRITITKSSVKSHYPENYASFDDFLVALIPPVIQLLDSFPLAELSVGRCIDSLESLGVSLANIDIATATFISKGVSKRIASWSQSFLSSTKQFMVEADRCKTQSAMITNSVFLTEHIDGFKDIYGSGFTMKRAYEIDNGIALFTYLALISSHLQTPSLDIYTPSAVECVDGTIAKQYRTVADIESDIERPIRFDKELDPTYYDNRELYSDIINSNNDVAQKVEVLSAVLAEKTGMKRRLAEQEASALILGYRPVFIDDYATVGETGIKFRWSGEKWEPVPGDSKSKDGKCILKENCLVFNESCITTGSATSSIASGLVKDHAPNLIISNEKKRTATYNDAVMRIKKLKAILVKKESKESANNAILASKATVPLTIISPTAPILERILSQGDFAVRMANINKFSSFFTRGSLADESKFWRYCNTSSAPILPTFLATLANAFSNNEDYQAVLDIIVSTQGTLAADGEAVIDRETGWEITRIALSSEEGYDESGFAIKTREVLAADIVDTQLLAQVPKTREMRTVDVVINALSELTSVKFGKDNSLLANEISMLLDRTLPSRAEYDIAMVNAKKKDTYENATDQVVILYSAAYFILFAQTALYLPRAKRAFPGCQRSFEGYPTGPITDVRGIDYIACILAALRTDERPWGSIKKLKDKSIAKKVKKIIERYVVNSSVASARITAKATSDSNGVPVSYIDPTERLLGFLPPPFRGHGEALADISDIRDDIVGSMRRGRNLSRGLLTGAIMKASYTIGLEMKKAMDANLVKDNYILTTASGIPYVENACCSTQSPSTATFFHSASPNIAKYNSYVLLVERINEIIEKRSSAPQIFDPTDTRLCYPTLASAVSKKTIGLAFVLYCESYPAISSIPDIANICSAAAKNPLVTRDELSQNLDDSSLAYDSEKLDSLMSLINAKRIVDIDVNPYVDERIASLRLEVERADIDQDVKTRLQFCLLNPAADDTKLVDVLDASSRNYISTYINLNKEFLTPKEYNSMMMCLSRLFGSLTEKTQVVEVEETEAVNLETMYNMIREYGVVLPNIVANSSEFVQEPIVPRHWDVSIGHSSDIVNMIKQTYAGLSEYYPTNLSGKTGKILEQTLKNSIEKNRALSLIAYDIGPIGFKGKSKDYVAQSLMFYLLSKALDNMLVEARHKVGIYTNARPTNALRNQTNQTISNDIEMGLADESLQLALRCSNTFLAILCRTQGSVEQSYEKIAKKALRAREKEKDLIVDYLTNMGDEAREVENAFKKHSIGRWSVGMQKGFKQYDKDTYDDERSLMDEQATREFENDKVDAVTGMQSEVYPSLSMGQILEDNILDGIEAYKGEDDNIDDDDFDGEM
tara:strand:- start:8487 stop:13931 length:5445 start_codon:yes stop_codon:yes gene_type:complete